MPFACTDKAFASSLLSSFGIDEMFNLEHVSEVVVTISYDPPQIHATITYPVAGSYAKTMTIYGPSTKRSDIDKAIDLVAEEFSLPHVKHPLLESVVLVWKTDDCFSVSARIYPDKPKTIKTQGHVFKSTTHSTAETTKDN